MTPRSNTRYGWVPDLPDHRDHPYLPQLFLGGSLPPSVDLRAKCPPVYDQGQLGSCTANAIAGAIDFARGAEGLPLITPSRLFIYYRERVIEGTVATDAGAMIRDGIKSVADKGACSESDWPYDITKFADMPPTKGYGDAWHDVVSSYARIDNTKLDDMRSHLAAGQPFVFGFTVYESFESQAVADTGVVPMPDSSERVLGGHAVLAVGYDDASQRFIVRNSWGTGWGQAGYFTIPYAYLTNPNLADDFWSIEIVEAR